MTVRRYSHPYAIVGCAIATVLILFSLRPANSTSFKWSLPIHQFSEESLEQSLEQPSEHSSERPLKGNFQSISAGRVEIDTTSEIGRASNATLGFQKIMVLGLPERHDKRDAIALTASLTGFGVEFVDAVSGEQVLDKARPPGLTLKGGALGCWRSHINAIRSVVENNIATAFLMEDDVDWDIRLLSQLPGFAKGVRSLSDISLTERQHSPYGDDWDILWPGHCGDVLPENDDRRYIIENDETVAPKAHQPWLVGLKDMPEQTRMVHKAGAPICTFGYAVSYRGAQKIMMALAVRGYGPWPIDNALAFLCKDGYLDIKCYSIEPQIFNHHRPAGSVAKDSDINGANANPEEIREKGFTEMIVLSARLNLEKVIMGTTDYVTQW